MEPPLWIASLHLRKTFDRILHQPLFETLHLQKVPEGYVHLLALLYKNQKESIDDKQFFDIQRGVKQGDTLSAMLFNAAIEQTLETKLSSEGFLLKENTCRLANVRYADDMLLFAKSREELENMLVLLIDELRKIGLDLNASKTKIFTIDVHLENFITSGDEKISIIEDDGKHDYLSRYISGILEHRGNVEVDHRIQCAWFKFGRHSSNLKNKNVSIKLRLKLFDSTVSPSGLFGLCVLPISQKNMSEITVAQNKMIRKIVGWTRNGTNDWESIMHNMKVKVTMAMKQFYVRPWATCIEGTRKKNFSRIASMDYTRWGKLSMDWDPTKISDAPQEYVAYRRPGRPLLRWTDKVVNDEAVPYIENTFDVVGVSPYRNSNRVVVPFFHLSTDNWW